MPLRLSRTRRRLGVESLECRTVPASLAGLSLDPAAHAVEHVLVRFRDTSATEGVAVAPRLAPGLREVAVPAGVTVEAMLTAFTARPDVVGAWPDYRVHLTGFEPDDPLYPWQWNLNNTGQSGGTPDADIDAYEAWQTTIGVPGVVVAVIDTGIDYNHIDLAPNMWRNPGEVAGNGIDDDGNGFADDVFGYDFVNNDADPRDDVFHGTAVAGVIAAVGANGQGVVGVAPGVRLMALKVFDTTGNGTTADVVRALDYAVRMGAQISNNSYAGETMFEQFFSDALESARQAGHIYVAAAGNGFGADNDLAPNYPSSYTHDNIIAVAASDHNDRITGLSSIGRTSVDLAAPGDNIFTTYPGGYGPLSGTSTSTPHVAGVVALVASQHLNDPTWTYKKTIDRVLATVDVIPAMAGLVATGGRLNAAKAVDMTPSVVGFQIDTGTQRSMVRSIKLTLSSAITQAQVSDVLAKLALTKVGGGAVTLGATLDATGKVLTLKFTGAGIIGGSLADGRYSLKYSGAEVIDSSRLFRLFGDVTGDGKVDSADATLLRAIPNGARRGFSASYNEAFDFNGNGILASDDRDQFNRRLGTSI